MKNNLLKTLVCLLFCTSIYAQRSPDRERRKEQIERVQAAKVGFLSDKVKLTEKQAQKFWPIYNDYSESRRELFKKIRTKIRDGRSEGMSDLEKSKLLDETMLLKEKDLSMQKAFKSKILNVISIDQYINLLSAEKEFNQLMIQRLGKRNTSN